MSFDKKKIGAKIAALRKDRKLTQEQLAEKVVITVQYLDTIRGKANTTLNRLDNIADILSCSSNDLIFSTTTLGTIAASMFASVFPVHGQPCISCILKNWMSPKLQRIPTENKQISELYSLILYIISQIPTKININLTTGIKIGMKCNFKRYSALFLHNSIQFQAENVKNISDEWSKSVDERS